MKYRFKPSILTSILTPLLMILFIKFGFWQWNKAEQKQALQATFDARLKDQPTELPQQVTDVEYWRYRRVHVRGTYDISHQILLDNQMNGDVAGYHVITPLKPANTNTYVLVDRGWVAMGDRSTAPQISTPQGQVEAVGFAWVPSRKFYELQAPPPLDGQWQPLWQNMDMDRFKQAVPFHILPFIIRLDANSNAGGFLRDWPRPAERIETHIGYAYQWFGFAAALLLIYLFVNLKKIENE